MKKIMVLLIGGILIHGANGMAWAAELVITGSTTVRPIAEKIAEAYKENYPGLDIKISGGGSGNGIKAIIDGDTDIGSASRFIKRRELRYAHGKGVYPVPFQVAYDCIVPIVHPENNVEGLSIVQLREIYTGSLDNWKVVGRADLPIRVISRDRSSGTYEVWEDKVMGGRVVLPSAHLEPSNAQVVKAVAADKSAIGYIGLGYLSKDVKALSVNGIEGSVETTLNGTYQLARSLFLFTRGWPGGETLRFVNYALSPNDGQKLVAECGFVPLYRQESSPCAQREVIFSDPDYLSETPANIQQVQRYLRAFGYPVGRPDGIKGEKTIRAMLAFQKKNNLALEWHISKKMVSVLSEKYMNINQ